MKHDTGQSRRDFLKLSTVAAAAAASGAVGKAAEPAEATRSSQTDKQPALVDVNVYLSRWPERRLPLDETPTLIAKLQSHGVTRAWAGSFDGLLYKNIAAVNDRLSEDCRKHGRGLLVPFGSVNPTLPDWEEDLRRCHEVYQMPGIRLHPNYHGYKLDEPMFPRLLDLAAQRGLVVQLVVTMEDERTQHRLMRVPNVDPAPLAGLLTSRPTLKLVLLNWSRGANPASLAKLAKAGQAYFDIATLEGVGGVANLLKQVPADRVLFGSYAPFYYFESALLKLKESELTDAQAASVRADNARAVLVER